MRLLHGRWRKLTLLHAAGALDGSGEDRLRSHLRTCADCAALLAETRAALDLVARDPLREAEPPVPLGALVARVRARIDEEAPAGGGRSRGWGWGHAGRGWSGLALAGTLAVIVVVALIGHRPPPPPVVVAEPAPPEEMVVPPDALRRLERTLERERAARYLSDAQDVLVTVAASPQHCRRRRAAVEVGAEAERSRELLARRSLFVDMDASATMAARDVLDDVEEMLREVAALDACARPQDLEAIRGEIARRRLLMKIDLVTRELQG